MKISKTIIILVLILVVAAGLRVFKLTEVPLYGDELTMVYDSYSILKTGQDSVGDFMPLTFKMGAGRPGGYIYAQLPFVALFGPTIWGERILSLLSGLGLIILMFHFGKVLFNEKIGLISAALTAFSPWGINLSRGGFEANFALLLAVLGTLCFISSKGRPYLLVAAALAWGLTIHTYPTYKLTIPLIILLLIWYQGGLKKILEKKVLPFIILSGFILIAAGILAILQTFTAGSETRFADINILSQENLRETLVQQINYERAISTLPEILNPLFSNSFFEYTFVIGEGYLKLFSLDFLFLQGARNPRHNMSTMGEFYVIEIISIIFGIYLLAKKERKIFILLILWVLLAPLPAALLIESHALRASFMFPPLTLISAFGLSYLWDVSKGKPYRFPTAVMFIVFFIQLVLLLERLYFIAPNEFSRFWSYPAQLASERAILEKNNFDFVILSTRIDNIEFAYPVYAKLPPDVVLLQNKAKTLLGGLLFEKFDNVYIGSIPDGLENDFIDHLPGTVIFMGYPDQSRNLALPQMVGGRDKLPAIVVRQKL